MSAVGLGCMGMSHAYGKPADRNEMMELLAEAVDMGYTLFDTAELYGSPGKSDGWTIAQTDVGGTEERRHCLAQIQNSKELI